MSNDRKNLIKIIITIFMIFVAIMIVFNYPKKAMIKKEITYREFMSLLNKSEISQVVIMDNNITITPKDTSEYKGEILYAPNMDVENLILRLQELNVSYSNVTTAQRLKFSVVIIFIVLIAFTYVVLRNRKLKKENKKLLNKVQDLENKDKS